MKKDKDWYQEGFEAAKAYIRHDIHPDWQEIPPDKWETFRLGWDDAYKTK